MEIAKASNKTTSFLKPVQFPDRLGPPGTPLRKRSALLDNLTHALQQNKLEPLIERHRVREERLLRIESSIGKRLGLPRAEAAQFTLDTLGIASRALVRVHSPPPVLVPLRHDLHRRLTPVRVRPIPRPAKTVSPHFPPIDPIKPGLLIERPQHRFIAARLIRQC